MLQNEVAPSGAVRQMYHTSGGHLACLLIELWVATPRKQLEALEQSGFQFNVFLLLQLLIKCVRRTCTAGLLSFITVWIFSGDFSQRPFSERFFSSCTELSVFSPEPLSPWRDFKKTCFSQF